MKCVLCGSHTAVEERCLQCSKPGKIYYPTPEQISAECDKIREGWSKRTKRTRAGKTEFIDVIPRVRRVCHGD